MRRGLIAAVLLSVLTLLGGIDFLEDVGWVQFSTSEMDRSLEDALDNYGEAIRSAENGLAREIPPAAQAAPDYASSTQGFLAGHLESSARRKQSLDFSRSAFDPLTYSTILLV